jgi:DNA excision repair protein ERCC-2
MPSTTINLFPHDVVRDGQNELMRDLEEAFSNGKILLAHAPTGLGKTASALSVALQHAIEKKKKVFFLTNRHTQHQIAVNTIKLINKKVEKKISCVDLIGKRWMCAQNIAGVFGSDFNEFCKSLVEKGECEYYNNVKTSKGVSVEAKVHLSELGRQGALHNEELLFLSNEKKMCGYEIAIELAKTTDVLIGDYYYLFNPHVMNTLFKKLNIEIEDVIVIVDEGHNLPNRVTDMVSSNLTTNMLKNGIIEARKFGFHGVIEWLHQMNDILQKLSKFENEKNKEKLITKDSFMQRITNYDDVVAELELAADDVRKKQKKSYLGGISAFMEAWKGDDEGFIRILAEKNGLNGAFTSLTYTCLDPSIVTKPIFDQVHAGVIMSGTLQPTFMYKDLLGITLGIEKEYSSPFPPENKVSIIVPETSTKFTLRGEAMFRKIAEKCSHFASLIPGNVAFFFPSYNLRDQVCYFFESDKKKFWEKPSMSKEEKDVFIAGFKSASDDGGVLLGVTGANFAEGVDFPGKMLQGVVIIGLPLGRPDLKTQESIKYYDGKFSKGWDYAYTFPAMSKCIQSAGRCIRSETDMGSIIFLDERFSWQRYFTCLPREGLIVSKEYEKILKEFWG